MQHHFPRRLLALVSSLAEPSRFRSDPTGFFRTITVARPRRFFTVLPFRGNKQQEGKTHSPASISTFVAEIVQSNERGQRRRAGNEQPEKESRRRVKRQRGNRASAFRHNPARTDWAEFPCYSDTCHSNRFHTHLPEYGSKSGIFRYQGKCEQA